VKQEDEKPPQGKPTTLCRYAQIDMPPPSAAQTASESRHSQCISMLASSAPPASLTSQIEAPTSARIELPVVTRPSGFVYPSIYSCAARIEDLASQAHSAPSFPPFFTRQQHAATWATQSATWTQLVLSFCRYHRLYRLDLGAASLAAGAPQAELWGNAKISRAYSVPRRAVVCSRHGRQGRCRPAARAARRHGGSRCAKTSSTALSLIVEIGSAAYDPPPTKAAPQPPAAYIYWRRPDEWGELIYAWVRLQTAQLLDELKAPGRSPSAASRIRS